MMVEEAVKSHLSGKGVDGIETWHGFNKPTQIHKIYQTCHKHGMWISMGSDSHGHATSAKGKKFGVGMAPGFEGEGATEEFREIELKTSTLHEVGSGEYFKKKSSNFEDSPFGK